MTQIRLNGTTCLLNPIRIDPILLMAQPEVIGKILQSWEAGLSECCDANFEAVFMRDKKRSQLRYGVSTDESDGHLTDALFKVTGIRSLENLSAKVEHIINKSFFPSATLRMEEVEIYIFSESFATCEWQVIAPPDFSLDQTPTLVDIENLMNEVSLAVTESLQALKFFERILEAIRQQDQQGIGKKQISLIRASHFTDIEHFLKKFDPKTGEKSVDGKLGTELMWTSRMVVADHALSKAAHARLVAGNEGIAIAIEGGHELCLTPAWGTSLLEGAENAAAYQDVTRIRRKLQAMYAVADNYNHSISELYFGVLAGGARISKALEAAIEACKTHLQQTLLIREDAGIGLQGWKRETYDAYLSLWKFDAHLGRAIKKVDLAMECVHTLRLRKSEYIQTIFRKILGSLAGLEILSLLMHTFEYAHSEHYESQLSWGILHILRFHGDPDAALTVMFVVLGVIAFGLLFSEGKATSHGE